MLEESASAIPSSIWESMNSWFTPTVLFLLLNLMIGTIALTSSFAKQKHSQNQNDLHQQQPNIARSPSVLQRLKSINFYTHYRSQETQDSSPRHKQNPDSDTLFNAENTNQSRHFEAQADYFFQHNSQENVEALHQSQTHYVFQDNSEEIRTHFDFEEKDSNFDDFQMAHEEKEDFQMAPEEKVEEGSEWSMDEVYGHLTGGHFSRTKSDTEPASGEFPAKLPARMRKSASLKSAFGHFEEEEIVEARRPATVREKGNAKMADVDEEVDAKADDFINKFKQQLKLQRLDSIMRNRDMIGRGSGPK